MNSTRLIKTMHACRLQYSVVVVALLIPFLAWHPGQATAQHSITAFRPSHEIVSPLPYGAEFGSSLAISENLLVIGAHREEIDGTSRGAAYVYRLKGSTWELEARLAPEAARLRFGQSVALRRDGPEEYVGVGALGDGSPGAAYVFTNSGGTWDLIQTLTGETREVDSFGEHLSIDDTILAISAQSDEHVGAVYVFRQNAEGRFEREARLLNEGPSFLGNIVAVSGRRILAGTSSFDPNYNFVHVFHQDGGGWTLDEVLDAPQSVGTESALAIEDDTVLLQSLLNAGTGASDEAVYVFERGPEGWTQTSRIPPFDNVTGNGFGGSLALRNGVALIAAPIDDTVGLFAGAAYVYRSAGEEWMPEARMLPPSGSSDTFLCADHLTADDDNVACSANSRISEVVYIFDLPDSLLRPLSVERPSAFGDVSISPHPVSSHAEIRLTLPAPSAVHMVVVDLLGRERQLVIDAHLSPGPNTIHLDSSALPSGVYFLLTRIDGIAQSRPIVIVD